MRRRVALVQPRIPDGNFIPNLGILYLAAVLERGGMEVRLFDESLCDDYLDGLLVFSPSVVGFTVVTAAVNRVSRAAERIKAALPDVAIVVGGPHPTALPEETLSCKAIDFCIVGEGEYAFFELCNAWMENGALEKVPNLVRILDGKVEKNQPRALLTAAELDALPYPAFHLLDVKRVFARVTHGLFRRGKRILPVMASRGCPFSCTFCCRTMGKCVRARSAEKVLDEIGHLVDVFGIDEVYFEDDNFTVNRERSMLILNGIRSRFPGLSIKFANGIRADRVDEPLLEAIKAAGGYWIGFGIESGSRRVLGLMKKGLDLDVARENVALAKRHGFKTGANFIIGYPGETWNDIMESIRFFGNLKLDSLAIVNLVPFPGTEARRICEQNGYLTPEASNYDNYYFGLANARPLISTPFLSSSETKLAIWLAYLFFYCTSWRRFKSASTTLVSRLLPALADRFRQA